MATVSMQEFLKQAKGTAQNVNIISSASPVTTNVPQEKSLGQKAKEVAVGFGKGIGSTVQDLQDLGQRGLAITTPSSLEEVRKETGIKPLAEADFGAKTGYEKAGKALEFVAELLFPAGKAGVLEKGQKVLTGSLDNLAQKASSIPDDIVEGGVKVKDKLIDMASKLDDKTKTALTRTPKEIFDKVVDQGRKALVDDRVQTPLEFVGESVANGLKKVKEIAQKVGEEKSSFIRLPTAFKGDAVKKFNEGLQSFLNNRSLIENDKGLVKEIVSQFKQLGNSPSQGMVDKFIDFAQERLYAGEKNLTLPVSNKTTAGLRNLISSLNNSLKNQLPEEYRTLNEKYSELTGLINELNTKLGKESGNAGALIKRLFSPSDARTKELFTELGKLTGQDYFRDARLSKFVMEALGDTRASSILEQIPKTKGQIFDRIIDFAIEKTGIKDPIKAAERFLESVKK